LTSINGLNPLGVLRSDRLLLTQIKEAIRRTGKIVPAPSPGADIVGRDDLAVAPLLSATQRDGQLQLTASGSWTAPHAAEVETLVESLAGQPLLAQTGAIDMQGVQEFDTYGAWLLRRLTRAWQDRGQPMRIVGLADRYQGLLQEVDQATVAAPAAAARKWSALDGVETVGRFLFKLGRDSIAFVAMVGALCLAVLAAAKRPTTYRSTSTVHHLDRVGWQAVPIILLITFLIGGIIAQQGFFHFRKFGADEYVVDMVGILVLREIGVLIVAIMVAGRSGSSYTAELGSMKMREEIDALRTMGFDPVDVLILPRIVALIIALPLLTFVGCMAALYGGGLVAWLYGGMSPEIFIARLKEAISLTHFKVGMIKAPFMALAIGVVAAVEGLKVKGSAESLGLQTTTSVVKSIFLVIVLDGLFAIFFASIGM
jgi:phospholipid/cholesterol/gamma-HCH transport system permease protein